MSKGYVKDKNGKYRLVEKDDNGKQEPIVLVNQKQLLTFEVLEARIKRLEGMLIGTQK